VLIARNNTVSAQSYIINQSFEGVGFENPGTESWTAVNGVPIEDPDDTFFHTAGSQCLNLKGATAECHGYWLGGTTNKTETFAFCSFTVSVTNANNAFMFMRSNTTEQGFVRVAATALVQIFDETGTAVGTTTDAVAPNTTYYVWAHWDTLNGLGDVEFSTTPVKLGTGTKFASFTGGGTVSKKMNNIAFECGVASASNHVDQAKVDISVIRSNP
jgi:hypothetical protein